MSRREKREAEENAKKGKKSVLKIIFILLLLIIIIGGISIFAWYELSLKPVEAGNSQSIIIDIVPGQGTEGIASALKENNLIFGHSKINSIAYFSISINLLIRPCSYIPPQ